MTWIHGTEERTYTIDAPLEEVADFFADPDRFHTCVDQAEDVEPVEDDTWRWTLQEMSVKGISFQGQYSVRYDRGDEQVVWETVGDDNNMSSEGEAHFEAIGDDRTRVAYEETIGVDVNIPSLMGSVIKPIASRMIGRGINSFLDCAKETLEGADT